MNEKIALGLALIAAAAMFGGMLGMFMRYGSSRAPLIGAAIGAVAAAALIWTQGIDVRDEERMAAEMVMTSGMVQDPA